MDHQLPIAKGGQFERHTSVRLVASRPATEAGLEVKPWLLIGRRSGLGIRLVGGEATLDACSCGDSAWEAQDRHNDNRALANNIVRLFKALVVLCIPPCPTYRSASIEHVSEFALGVKLDTQCHVLTCTCTLLYQLLCSTPTGTHLDYGMPIGTNVSC